MANLYEVLADAQNGEAMSELGRQFGLSPQQTQAAVAALLPAISMGLKRATATPEGLGNLLAVMGAQPDFDAMYDDPQVAFSREGRAAGNTALARMFGSPEASWAIADQAQQLSGISSSILKKLLPVLAGIIISSLMKSGSGKAAPSAPAPQPAPDLGGGLGDILRQIFRQGSPESTDRVQAQLPKPHRKKMAASAISLGPDRAISFRRAANRARFQRTPVVKLVRAVTFSLRSCASLPRQLRRGVSSRSLSVPSRSASRDNPVLPAKRSHQWATFSDRSCGICWVAKAVR